MNKYNFLISFLLFYGHAIGQPAPASFVNPFIGTSNYGATHPGAVLPAGMASVVPFNVAFRKGAENQFEKDSEWHSRTYVHENGFLTGFAHVNLSGVGCPELGSILLFPTAGDLEMNAARYGTTYSNEEASPGYYSTHLEKYAIDAEMSATLRTGVSRYSFPAGQANILLNLGLGLTNETGGMLRVVNDREVEGYKLIGTFCYNPEDVRPVYFVARLNRPADHFGAWKKMPKYGELEAAWTKYDDTYKTYEGYRREIAGDSIGAYFTYFFEAPASVEVQVGISYVSIENARQNLERELGEQSFEEVRSAATAAWNQQLGRIKIEGGTQEDKTVFYTALYHLLLHPNVLQDVNGDYPALESYAVKNTGGERNRYTVFSLWDTYRNVHPFLSLVYPDLQLDLLRSMLDMYRESGWLPKWELLSMETGVMVGDPATPVIYDTYARGLTDFDVELAYEAARKAATQLEDNKLRPALTWYDSLGYIPENAAGIGGTVSTTLEYNISDWNLAQLAKVLGKDTDYRYFLDRSHSYRNYFDPETGMLRPRMADGDWLTPFNPEAGKNFEPVIGFIEGNAWQYRFYVPHDIPGLMQLLGGQEAFLKALQACFETDNFDMANEPDITYPYLFNYIDGAAWQTQTKVRELLRQYYFNGPDGLPGNDDTGTLSTWLLYSMMGLYPDCPGSTQYALTSPVFDRITIPLDQSYYPGKELVIETVNNDGDNNIYIERVEWNGRPLKSFFVDHKELVKGGVLRFFLKDSPSKN